MIMAMQAATVEILIEKGKFEPRVAVAIAEAMDEALDSKAHQLQLVTLPMLDERLTALREKLEGRIEDKIGGLENKIDGIETRLEDRIDGIETRLESKIEGIADKLEGRIQGVEIKLEGKIQGIETKLERKIDGIADKLEGRIGGLQGDIRNLHTEVGKQDAKGQSMKGELMRFVLLAIMGQFAMITGMVYFLVQQLR